MIRAVLFDVGGPLDLEAQFEAAIDADIRAGLAREGFPVDDASYAEARHRDQQARSWDERPDAGVEDAAGILKAVLSLLERDG